MIEQVGLEILPIPDINLTIGRSVNLWKLEGLKPDQKLSADPKDLSKIADITWISKDHDSRHLAMVDTAGYLHVVNMLSQKLVLREKIGENWITCVEEERSTRETLCMGGIEGNIYIAANRISKGKGVRTTTAAF